MNRFDAEAGCSCKDLWHLNIAGLKARWMHGRRVTLGDHVLTREHWLLQLYWWRLRFVAIAYRPLGFRLSLRRYR